MQAAPTTSRAKTDELRGYLRAVVWLITNDITINCSVVRVLGNCYPGWLVVAGATMTELVNTSVDAKYIGTTTDDVTVGVIVAAAALVAVGRTAC